MKKETLLIIVIFIFGLVLRLIFLASIPPELNRDELSLGFNAYSLLATGKDEHGRGPWPIIFRSFGDYKLPGYIYLLIPFIRVFNLTSFTVRLPSAIFGALSIVIVYLLIKELWPQKKYLALTSSLLLSFAPFHLHYSRQAYEAIVALFFNLCAILCLLKARKKSFWLGFSLICFTLAIYFYNTPLFIFPPLAIWTFIVFRKKYLNNALKKAISGGWLILLIAVIILYLISLKEANQGKANTTIFSQEVSLELINHNIFFLNRQGIPIPIARLIYNKPVALSLEFLKNYSAAFSPKFIFFSSDNNPWHSLGSLNYGNLLFLFLPFIILGFISCTNKVRESESIWFLGYLLIAPIINGATIDSPILNRLLDFHLVLTILAAIGLLNFIQWRMPFKRLVNISTIVFLFFISINYLITYFLVFPQSPDIFWMPGIKEVGQIVKQEGNKYDFIVFDPPIDLAYIYLAFYVPFNPADFQQNAKRATIGFDDVYRYGKYLFKLSGTNQQNDVLKEAIQKKQKILVIKRLNGEKTTVEKEYQRLITDHLNQGLWQLSDLSP